MATFLTFAGLMTAFGITLQLGAPRQRAVAVRKD